MKYPALRYSAYRRRRIGRRLRRSLSERGFSLTAIAGALGVSVSLVHHVVYGDKGRLATRHSGSTCGRKARMVRRWIAEVLCHEPDEIWPGLVDMRAGRPARRKGEA
jgi:hypothetical protein